eukprot:6093080-Pyramimonas_sp.AAC.1
MRHHHPFVAPYGAPPKVPVAASACVTAAHYGTPLTRFVAASRLHRRLQWQGPHVPPPPRTAFRGPIWSSTEGSSGKVRMRHRHPGQRFVAP